MHWEDAWFLIRDMIDKRTTPKGQAHHWVKIEHQKGLEAPSA